MKEETVEQKKGAHELGQLTTSLVALTDQFREGKAYLHLKLNLAKSYRQEASPNYTHSVMETWKTYLIYSIECATTARCCSASRSRYQKMEKCNNNVNE